MEPVMAPASSPSSVSDLKSSDRRAHTSRDPLNKLPVLTTKAEVRILAKAVLLMCAAFIFCLAAMTPAGAIQLVAPTEPVAQGEVVLVSIKELTSNSSVKGLWQGDRLEFFKGDGGEYRSLLGIDLKLKPGTYPLKVIVNFPKDRPQTLRTTLEVVEKDYGLQRLSLPQNMVTLDPQTLRRVRKEGARFRQLWPKQSPNRYWRGSFVRPVPGELTTPFGLNPHSGVDMRAAVGEPVRSANHGRIALVGEFYFNGKSVVIDHGWGVYTMYFHLSEVNVSEGDFVGKETIIGLAGSTGRSTGPHLHWGVRVGGARVNPLALMRVSGE